MITRSKITGSPIHLNISLFLFLIIPALSHGQLFQTHYQFAEHLRSLKAYDEGLFYLNRLSPEALTIDQKDTLNYLTGKFYYYKQDQTYSIRAFDQVGISSPFYRESWLLANYQRFYLGNYLAGKEGLGKYTTGDDPLTVQLKNFQLAGVALLERDTEKFEVLRSDFKDDYRELIPSQEKLIEIAESIENFNSKSPFVAALFSAVIPGSGRIYNGRLGEGLISMLAHTIFALQSIEGYQKDGPGSARFLIYSSILSGFYIANVWGSALSVKIRMDEFNDQTDHTTLLTMHVPLRFLFD